MECLSIIRNNDALAMKCTCPAYDLRGGFCKHLVALMYAIEAERMGMVQTIRRPPSLRLAAQLLAPNTVPLCQKAMRS